MKWKYGEKIKIASINVRGMRDPVKREEIITQMDANGIDLMCLQETKSWTPAMKLEKDTLLCSRLRAQTENIGE